MLRRMDAAQALADLTEISSQIVHVSIVEGGTTVLATTIDDPGAYTKPFTYTQPLTLQTDSDLLEYYCTENEKDIQHYQ